MTSIFASALGAYATAWALSGGKLSLFTIQIAFEVNERTENIGARRLHTVVERLLETVLFEAPDCDSAMTVDAAYVDKTLGELVKDEDLSRYIL